MENENRFDNTNLSVEQQNVNSDYNNTIANQCVVQNDRNESGDGRKKILTAFLMLIVTAISLTTASYAWFTENTTVTVDSIDVNVSAANGIQVSVDAVNWKANISTTDITTKAYSGNANQLPSQIVPVSTYGDVDSSTGFMNMYKGSLVADASTAHGYKLVSTKTTETKSGDTTGSTNGDFIAFDLFILTTEQTTVYLTTSSDVVAKGADAGLKNAARVAFLNEGSADTGNTSAAIALKGAASHSTAAQKTNIIWEPNSDIHTAAGVAQAMNYGLTSFTTSTVVSNYLGIKTEFTDDSGTPIDYQSNSTTYFGTVTPDIQTKQNNSTTGEYKTLFTLDKGINKIRIYGWVEGQDYDCENNASGTNITFNIQISKNSSAA